VQTCVFRSRWIVFGKERFPGDRRVIEGLVGSFMGTPVTRPEKPASTPKAHMLVTFTNNWDQWSVHFSKDASGVLYYQREGEPWYFKATRAVADLLPPSQIHFRDRRVFPEGEILTVTRTGLGLPEEISVDSRHEPRIVKPIDLPLSTRALGLFYTTVKNLRAHSFLGEAEKKALLTPLASTAKPQTAPDKASRITAAMTPPGGGTTAPKGKEQGAKSGAKTPAPVSDRPFARSAEVTLSMSNGTTLALRVDLRRPLARLGKTVMRLTSADHRVLITPWVRDHPFEWGPSLAESFVFTDGTSGWRIRRHSGYWIMEEKGKRTILTPESVRVFLAQVSAAFSEVHIMGYGSIPRGQGGYMQLTREGGLPQTISLKPHKDRIVIWNRRWPVLWSAPMIRAAFLFKEGAARLTSTPKK
ncbi:hypothetical protein KKF84_17065, partial [Myxococcota bacterium]|nr:hypothetical protein [Myxococcota bacterium]